MKTKEFIKKVEKLGYLIDDSSVYWQIRNEENSFVALVHKNALFRISTDFVGWWNIEDEDRNQLFDLIVEFTKTPIEDRKEEKKFYLRHRWLGKPGETNYLNIELGGNLCYLNDNRNLAYMKTKFTLNEIEEIEEKYNTDLMDFELVEVEE